jgi:hypothetical protein
MLALSNRGGEQYADQDGPQHRIQCRFLVLAADCMVLAIIESLDRTIFDPGS